MINLGKKFLPGQTIGIIGGDELGRLSANACHGLGLKVLLLDPNKDCPAAQVCDEQIIADFDDLAGFEELAVNVHGVIYTTEAVPTASLRHIQPVVPVIQSIDLLEITKDRLLEKAFLEDNNIVLAPYATIVNVTDIQDAIDGIGYPCVLKTAEKGHAGHGQMVLYSPADIRKAIDLLRFGTCVLEAWIPLEKELVVTVFGNERQEVSVLPAVEVVQKKNRWHQSIVPARVLPEVATEAQRIAKALAKNIELTGVLNLELFVGKNGAIYVNEVATVPSIANNLFRSAANFSQYDLLARSCANWSLGSAKLLATAVSVNILSQDQFESEKIIDAFPDWDFQYYGKLASGDNQPVGYITILTEDIYQTLEAIYQTQIWD